MAGPEDSVPVPGAAGGVDSSQHPRARAGRETSTRVARLRVILNRLGEPGARFDDEACAELAAEHGVSIGQIQRDVGDANVFVALGSEPGGMRPFFVANLAEMALDAKQRGKLSDGAKVLEVLARITGDIAPAQMNLLVDARTGGLKPEIARAMQVAQDELITACRRAAIACGADGAAFDAALVAEMDAPALVGGG